MNEISPLARLQSVLRRHGPLAIAVSGGVDSMTLAHVAHAILDVEVVHAMSPAVPAEASSRVVDHAKRHGWRLITTDAGEFADPRYRQNPVNRCYFCKNNLYARIAALTERTIASGANLDDLGDYRPGLVAASERNVVHPFVEAGIGKAELRGIARSLGLGDIADLPAQPCLASRIETGIAIDAGDLAFVHAVEQAVRRAAPQLVDVRCRILKRGVVLEADAVNPRQAAEIEALARVLSRESGRVFAGVAPYRRGAAFVHEPSVALIGP